MKARIFLIYSVFIYVCLFAPRVNAAERFDFTVSPPPSALLLLETYFTSYDESLRNYDFSAADLNSDGIDEYILKRKTCEGVLCPYKILAQSQGSIVEIGEFSAQNILLGNDYTHGVRNLLIFATPGNDYAYNLYQWSPQNTRYESGDIE